VNGLDGSRSESLIEKLEPYELGQRQQAQNVENMVPRRHINISGSTPYQASKTVFQYFRDVSRMGNMSTDYTNFGRVKMVVSAGDFA
jgi:hypothetical protein